MMSIIRKLDYVGSADIMAVDGGYLSWCVGTRDESHLAWRDMRWKFTPHAGSIICLDSPSKGGWREQVDSNYKLRRRNNVNKDGVKERVNKFVNDHWDDDPGLCVFTAPELEADDLVALIALATEGSILGIDKDLLQLPGVTTYRLNGSPVSITEDFAQRYAGRLYPAIRKPIDVLTVLATMGDRSDGIQRSLPKKDGNQWLEALAVIIATEPYPMQLLASLLGPTFVNNLYLAVLPCPGILIDVPTPSEVLELVDRREWYTTVADRSLWKPKLRINLERCLSGTNDALQQTIHVQS